MTGAAPAGRTQDPRRYSPRRRQQHEMCHQLSGEENCLRVAAHSVSLF